jgi:hypothetical protein
VKKIGKGLVAVASALVLVGTGLAACAGPARSGEPSHLPPGAEQYELPDGHDGVIGGWTWCSHGVRLWQSYAWEDSSNGARVLALTSQEGAC